MIDYGTVPGVNFSTLKHMAKSPLAYRHAVDNPRADTASLRLGRYVHALVFEPQNVDASYAVYEHGARRGKVWDAYSDLYADKTILTESEARPARDMAAAVRAHPLVRPYLDAPDGVFEEVITWVDPYTRIACKARLDWHIKSLGVLVDLKTTRSIEMRAFGADVARYEYHCQLAHYANGLDIARGWMPRRQLFVAVEKAAPHDVLVGVVDEQAKDLARNAVSDLLGRVAECRASSAWPGRYAEEQTVQLPGWVFGGEPEIEFEGDDDGAH